MRWVTATRPLQLFWWMASACCPRRTPGGRQSIGNGRQRGSGVVMAVGLVAAVVNVVAAPAAQAATDHSTVAPTRVDNGNGVAKATPAPHAGTVTGTSRAQREAAAVAVPTLTTTASPPVLVGREVSDTATLDGGVSPTGTITFILFGPGDLTCAGAPAFTWTVPVSGRNGNYTSAPFRPTAVGTYRWMAAYSGDANNAPVSTVCNDANESVFVFGTRRITLATEASAGVKLGGQVSDAASLANGVSPTGTITFRLFGPGNATCTGAAAFTSTKPVSDNGNYTSAPFKPTVVGTYRWIAAYSGDANNSPVSTVCNDAFEAVVVTALTVVSLTARASHDVQLGGQVSDTATLAGGVSPTGTITFRLFGPGNATCSGTAAFTSTKQVSGNGSYTSGPFTPAVVGTYRWIAAYSGDANNSPVSTVCNAPGETVRVTAVLPVTGIDVRSLATLAVGLLALGCLFIIVSSGASRRVRRRT
jgi:hypothetical protein